MWCCISSFCFTCTLTRSPLSDQEEAKSIREKAALADELRFLKKRRQEREKIRLDREQVGGNFLLVGEECRSRLVLAEEDEAHQQRNGDSG